MTTKNRIYCNLVKIDSQGYVDGRYFGVNHGDQRLYVITDSNGYTLTYKRSTSRNDAIESYKLDCMMYNR